MGLCTARQNIVCADTSTSSPCINELSRLTRLVKNLNTAESSFKFGRTSSGWPSSGAKEPTTCRSFCLVRTSKVLVVSILPSASIGGGLKIFSSFWKQFNPRKKSERNISSWQGAGPHRSLKLLRQKCFQAPKPCHTDLEGLTPYRIF